MSEFSKNVISSDYNYACSYNLGVFFHPNFFITICMTIFPILSANLDQSAHGRVNPPV